MSEVFGSKIGANVVRAHNGFRAGVDVVATKLKKNAKKIFQKLFFLNFNFV